MEAQEIKDVLTVSRILAVSSDPAVVIASLIEWRDGTLGVVEVVAAQAEIKDKPEPPAPAKAPPAKAAPAKAAGKGRAKPPPSRTSEPDDSVGGEFEASPDPSDDADF